MRPALRLASLLIAASALASAAEKFSIQYFYDELDSELYITDFAMPSATHGVAVGEILNRNGRAPKSIAIVTSDGGEHWTQVPLKETPRSLFMLNDSMGWVVTDKGIWFTEESGRSWQKVGEQIKGAKTLPPVNGGLILRVGFVDAMHGYAIGLQKLFQETKDGGKTWAPAAEKETAAGNPAFTAYTNISIDTPRIVINGTSTPPRAGDAGRLPAWLDPAAEARRNPVPYLMILIQSIDAGASWHAQTTPLIGTMRGIQTAGPRALTLFHYTAGFDWPSEVFRLDLRDPSKNGSVSAYREKDRRVTSMRLFPGPVAYLAAIEPPGKLASAAIPGKIRIVRSNDLEQWDPIPVDYKAVASDVLIVGPDPEHIWVATNNGMILKLSR